eukprot:4788937-Alexandrium_andersonii.AAC.1
MLEVERNRSRAPSLRARVPGQEQPSSAVRSPMTLPQSRLGRSGFQSCEGLLEDPAVAAHLRPGGS